MTFDLKKDGKRILMLCAASLLMAVNIKTFVRTADLFPGGAAGLTILLQRIGETYFGVLIPYTVVNLLLNAVPVYIGYRFIGKKFTLYSCLMIVLTSVLTDIIPAYVITYDVLLLSVFGGIINGAVVSMCLLADATSGGTDFIAIFLSDRKGVDSFNVILGVNVVILSVAGILFGWEKALYSIIFQYASTQILHMLYRKYQQATLFVVTNKAKEVCQVIFKISNHGATVMDSEGSYEGQARQMVYSVVSSAESKQVVEAVRKTDPGAFVNVVRTEQLQGKFYHKPQE